MMGEGHDLYELQRKIDYEQKKYRNYLLLCSTADVVSRAKEIYIKQMIYEQLSSDIKAGKINRNECMELLRVDDLIDKIYLKSKDSSGNNCIDKRVWNYMLNAVRF